MQNYQVFINEHLLEFTTSPTKVNNVDNFLQLFHPTEEELSKLVLRLFEEPNYLKIEVVSNEIESLWSGFLSCFEIVAAAGGLVKNQDGNYLIIHRLGKWDLPKGKIEKGENIEEAAIREVQEECGIEEVEIEHSLSTTYHMYQLRGETILKPTYWYLMKTDYNQELVPQIEEDISKAEWCNLVEFKIRLSESYASLRNLITNSEL